MGLFLRGHGLVHAGIWAAPAGVADTLNGPAPERGERQIRRLFCRPIRGLNTRDRPTHGFTVGYSLFTTPWLPLCPARGDARPTENSKGHDIVESG
jgi:hypothetical protein